AGSTSMRSSPPVMSLIFWARSRANSWKMSTVGQVLWKRKDVGVCALTMAGKPSVAAAAVPAAAPPRKRRRDACTVASVLLTVELLFIGCLLVDIRSGTALIPLNPAVLL